MNKPITTALTQRESPDKAQKAKILAMPACDYMNDEQLAFFASGCWMSAMKFKRI